ncbi:MAG: M23 family metallopeptidase [Cyclobacteriaceae bacterium]|nr:M23 family metallopeptidase [Cyclobacteriaceae bacterium]
MARIKYYYDTETCKYERVKVGTWDVVLSLLGFLSVSVVIAIIMVLVHNTYFETPKEAAQSKEIQELLLYYEIMNKETDNLQEMMVALQKRDDDIYRVINEAEPIPGTIREGGIGGTDRYRELLEQGLEREDLILTSLQKIERLKKQMYIQTKSYDEIVALAKSKDKMYASIPAIQPITNKELTRLASGFGMRIDPIYKVRRMHTGVDFSATRGTPIYATGDGVIKKVVTNYGGYGKEVLVDHGYGYVTRYAHMSDFNVQKGQKIKRGECIGYVGSTGKSTAPHLHYEVLKDGKKVNPVHYFYNDLNEDEYQKILELSSIENQSLG